MAVGEIRGYRNLALVWFHTSVQKAPRHIVDEL